VAYQAVKYRQREGWSHRDLLRLAHPKTDDTARADLLDWICRGWTDDHAYPSVVNGYEMAQRTTSTSEWAKLVADHNLPWEALPDAAMNDAEVWSALLPSTGITALIRQLGRLTNIGIVAPLGGHTDEIVGRLTSSDELKKGRVHPLQVLSALVTYESGHGFRGQSSWTPVPKIVEALNEAFYLAFDAVDPANKKTLVGLDVSGSMSMGNIANSPLMPFQAEAAMAMVAIRTEPEVFPMAFSGGFVPLSFGKTSRLDAVIRAMEHMPFDRTDCAVPMVWALRNKVPVETFQVFTDNETWAGGIHPFQALRQYREQMGIDARLIVVGMTSTGFSISDPSDVGMLDVVGFDGAAPNVMTAFSRGEV
jgi:60 kDa SS-A/Ro ribonucleoprotein